MFHVLTPKLLIFMFSSTCINSTKTCHNMCQGPAPSSSLSDNSTAKSVEQKLFNMETIAENFREMVRLFGFLYRRYRGHNQTLATSYQQQNVKLSLILEDLQYLHVDLASSSVKAFPERLQRTRDQLTEAWHMYEEATAGANINITNAYKETFKVLDLVQETLLNQTGKDTEAHDTNGHPMSEKCEAGTDGLRPDPEDCAYFLHCVQSGVIVRKKCGPGTLFNPLKLICDWPLNVYKAAPICQRPQRQSTIVPNLEEAHVGYDFDGSGHQMVQEEVLMTEETYSGYYVREEIEENYTIADELRNPQTTTQVTQKREEAVYGMTLSPSTNPPRADSLSTNPEMEPVQRPKSYSSTNPLTSSIPGDSFSFLGTVNTL
jgi:hypothetical protein